MQKSAKVRQMHNAGTVDYSLKLTPLEMTVECHGGQPQAVLFGIFEEFGHAGPLG